MKKLIIDKCTHCKIAMMSSLLCRKMSNHQLFFFFLLLFVTKATDFVVRAQEDGDTTAIISDGDNDGDGSDGVSGAAVAVEEDFVCFVEEMDMYNCMDSGIASSTLLNAPVCEQCVADVVPLTPEYCSDLTDALCPAIHATCPCQGCQHLIEKYVVCGIKNVTGCDVTCEDYSYGNAADTTATNILSDCTDERETLNNCIGSNIEGDDSFTCEKCMVDSNLFANATCNQWEKSMCTAIRGGKCLECEGCLDEIETYYQCSLPSITDKSCNLDCSEYGVVEDETTDQVVAPATDVKQNEAPIVDCSVDRASLFECFGNKLSDVDASLCGNCIGSRVPSLGSACDTYQTNLCTALTGECEEACGSCVTKIETFFDCSLVENGVLGCKLNCFGDDNDDSNGCNDEKESFEKCLEEQLGGDGASASNSCIANADSWFTDPTQITCSSLQDNVCLCGQCRETAEKYLRCSFGGLLDACTLDECADVAQHVPTDKQPLSATPPPTPVIDQSELAPTSSPISPVSSECAVQYSEVQYCLSTTLATERHYDCTTCLDQAYKLGLEESLLVICVDISAILCPAIITECDCGLCRRPIEAYYDCEVNQVASHCNVNCDNKYIGSLNDDGGQGPGKGTKIGVIDTKTKSTATHPSGVLTALLTTTLIVVRIIWTL